jgi:transposase
VVVTEHRAHSCVCPSCQTVTSASFPEGVAAPVQYGARICAFVVYLLNYHFLLEDWLAELLSDLFGLKLVPATIARMSAACVDRFRGFADTARQQVAAARVKHLDETGFRIGGRTRWLHIFSTALLTFYRTCSKERKVLPMCRVRCVTHVSGRSTEFSSRFATGCAPGRDLSSTNLLDRT